MAPTRSVTIDRLPRHSSSWPPCLPCLALGRARWSRPSAPLVADPHRAVLPRSGVRSSARSRRASSSPADGKSCTRARPGRTKRRRAVEAGHDISVAARRAHQPNAGRRPCHPGGPRRGTFLPAFRHESHRNEHSEIWIDHEGTQIVVRQVVGVMARRVVCRVDPPARCSHQAQRLA